MSRAYDIVIFGATGFSGKLLTEYLVKNYGGVARLAIAGRNKAKLEKLRSELSQTIPSAAALPILISDSSDLASLKILASQTKVVASTVGPFAKYGTPLVEACASTGTSYCDLTGESDWHATMFNKFEAQARESGARIVHQAGFDSVPSDTGAFLAARDFRKRFGRDCEKIEMYVSVRGGGIQGGTIDTLMNEIVNGSAMRAANKASREGAPPLPKAGRTVQVWTKGVSWSPEAKKWGVPFFMAGANMPYVARTNGRLGYSDKLEYSESMAFRSLLVAIGAYLGLITFGLLLVVPPTRWLLKTFVLPAPGQGPSRESCLAASYRMQFVATGGGDRTDVQLKAVGDASCISTTCCLAETAMALSMDAAKLDSPGGVMTAMSAMGDVLLERLRATPLFEITAGPPSKL